MPDIIAYHVTERGGTDSLSQDVITEKHVIVTDVPVSIEFIARHRRTPKLNTEHTAHPGFWYDSVSPKQVKPVVWEIDVHATTFQFPEIPESPLDEAASISLDSEIFSEPTLFDYKGRPIVTTAGEWIADVNVERCHWVYKVTKNVGSDPEWLDDYGAAINSDSVRLRGRVRKPNTLMLRRISLSPYTKKNRVSFSTLSFELHYRPEGWIHRKWNRGTLQLIEFKTPEGKKAWRQEKILAGNPSQPVSEPVALGKNGRIVPGVLDPNGDTPLDVSKLIVLKIQTQLDKPFAKLPLT